MTRRRLAYVAYIVGSAVFLVAAVTRGSPLLVAGSALFLLGSVLFAAPELLSRGGSGRRSAGGSRTATR